VLPSPSFFVFKPDCFLFKKRSFSKKTKKAKNSCFNSGLLGLSTITTSAEQIVVQFQSHLLVDCSYFKGLAFVKPKLISSIPSECNRSLWVDMTFGSWHNPE